MNFKINTIFRLFLVAALIFVNSDSFAQGGPPCPRPPCPKTPITGIEILIAGGAAFGIKKLMKAKKSNL